MPSTVTPNSLEFMGPGESVEIGLREREALATCESGNALVLLEMQRTSTWGGDPPDYPTNPSRAAEALPPDINIKPGDFLALTSGGNSMVDIGYGPGVYPIVTAGVSEVTLSVTLTSSDASAWNILRRR
jgi:hypothetical protein